MSLIREGDREEVLQDIELHTCWDSLGNVLNTMRKVEDSFPYDWSVMYNIHYGYV